MTTNHFDVKNVLLINILNKTKTRWIEESDSTYHAWAINPFKTLVNLCFINISDLISPTLFVYNIVVFFF